LYRGRLRKYLTIKYFSKPFLALFVALSLAGLAGPLSSGLTLPGIPLAHAVPQPCPTMSSFPACAEYWYPAGPEMDNFQTTLFSNCLSEYNSLTSVSPTIDLTDCSLQSFGGSTTICNPATIYMTAASPNNYCYLSNWMRAANDDASAAPPYNVYNGLPNYFTWLNAYSSTPAVPGTIRQGFSLTTASINPFVASTAQDQYIVRNVYDSLYAVNPLNPSQVINWMTALTTNPLPLTYQFTLYPGLSFQDGTPVTSFDAVFSYLSLIGSGSFLGTSPGTAGSCFVSISPLSLSQFQIVVPASCTTPLSNLTNLPILPGRYWTNLGSSAWDTAVHNCALVPPACFSPPPVYGLGPGCTGPTCPMFPATLVTVNPSDPMPTNNPIANHTFVGSGPWQCGTVTSATVPPGGTATTGGGSGTCTTSGNYSLTRFGAGLPPASSVSSIYFRSSGNLALYIWSEENDISPLIPFSEVAACFGKPVTALPPCNHWQQGIGANGGPISVGLAQVSIVSRFYGINWISPFDWATLGALPTGMFPFNQVPPPVYTNIPVLYEGPYTLQPSLIVGCAVPYPAGGYDC
jgi:hypothetical protein